MTDDGIDKEQAQSDVEALKSYEAPSDGSELILDILNIIDEYGTEVRQYLTKGSYQELTDFRIYIEAAAHNLSAALIRLIGRLTLTDEVPDIISILVSLSSRTNRAYLTSMAIGGRFCSDCVNYCIDTEYHAYTALFDQIAHDYNPEIVVKVFTDSIKLMNIHILEHLEIGPG